MTLQNKSSGACVTICIQATKDIGLLQSSAPESRSLAQAGEIHVFTSDSPSGFKRSKKLEVGKTGKGQKENKTYQHIENYYCQGNFENYWQRSFDDSCKRGRQLSIIRSNALLQPVIIVDPGSIQGVAQSTSLSFSP